MSKEDRSRFRIKWADREVEYCGDEAKLLYENLIEYVKSIPIPTATTTAVSLESRPPVMPQPSVVTENKELQLISNDCGIPVEQLADLVQFKTFKGFKEAVPYLPRHPRVEDATLCVCYALQVGLQKEWLEVAHIKDVLTQVNGYPLPGRTFGLILQDLRNRRWTIASGTKEKYKPFCLSSNGGLAAARDLMRRELTRSVSA